MTSDHDGSGLAPAAAREAATDLHAYWRTLVRRRWLILSWALVFLVGAIFITLRQTRIFEATTTLVIDLAAPRVLDSQQVQDVVESGTGIYWYSKEYYQTQYKIIMSRAVATRVVDNLKLADNLKFLGLDKIADPAAREQRRKQLDPVLLAQKRLSVEPVRDSRIVLVRVEDPDPAMAAELSNAFAAAYIAENLAVKVSTTRNASEWLEQQLSDLQFKVEKSATELNEFKRTHDIVSTSWEDKQSMVSQRLVALNEALTKTRTQKAQLQARSDGIRQLQAKLKPSDELPDGLQAISSNQLIQQLKLRYADVKNECLELRERYEERHPKLIACNEKQRSTWAMLLHEVQSTLGAAEADYEEAAKTENYLNNLYNETKREAFQFNQHEREYVELKRAWEGNQRLYDLVLKRLKEAQLSGMMHLSNVRILDEARTPTVPIRPNPKQNLLLALFLGLLLGLGFASGIELLDTTIVRQDQIEEQLGLTFLGVIPTVGKTREKSTPDLLAHVDPKSVVAECCRSIRTNLLFMSPDRPLKSILVTSSGPQDGKTTTAISLAITMAESGNRVLLIDADLRRPRVHSALTLPNSSGVSSLIFGDVQPESVIKATEVPNLYALTSGPVPPNPAQLLHATAFAEMLQRLSQSYDRMIIDSPPAGVVADPVILSTLVDGTLLVVRARRTSRDAARRSIRSFLDVNARLLGIVLNDSSLQEGSYQGYYYERYGHYAEQAEKPV